MYVRNRNLGIDFVELFRSILNGSSHTTKCAYHYKNNDGILSRNQLNHAIAIIGKKKKVAVFPKKNS